MIDNFIERRNIMDQHNDINELVEMTLALYGITNENKDRVRVRRDVLIHKDYDFHCDGKFDFFVDEKYAFSVVYGVERDEFDPEKRSTVKVLRLMNKGE